MIKSLPPEPKLRFDSETITLLNAADYSLNRLDGILTIFSENHIISSTLKLREAIESLRIDGYPFSLTDYFSLCCLDRLQELSPASNYLSASNLGLRLIKNVSRSGHIIKSIHNELTKDTSQEISKHNAYRSTHNLKTNEENRRSIKYVPPPEEIPFLMERLESYIASDVSYPLMINAALVHAQLERIHPFDSHNGLTGRILIQLHVQWKKRFVNNCLQISNVLNKRKNEYFELLEDLEKNEGWLEWIKFFLTTMITSANDTIGIIKSVFDLEQTGYKKILDNSAATPVILKLYNYVFFQPIITIPHITKSLSFTKQTANVVVSKLLELNILEEVTGKQRYRKFKNKKFLEILK
ncbi:MAG: Fic family protein [Melioribacteraceae bacterium]|nr:Fic family protein [Melioribacteraceae bacterium]